MSVMRTRPHSRNELTWCVLGAPGYGLYSMLTASGTYLFTRNRTEARVIFRLQKSSTSLLKVMTYS